MPAAPAQAAIRAEDTTGETLRCQAGVEHAARTEGQVAADIPVPDERGTFAEMEVTSEKTAQIERTLLQVEGTGVAVETGQYERAAADDREPAGAFNLTTDGEGVTAGVESVLAAEQHPACERHRAPDGEFARVQVEGAGALPQIAIVDDKQGAGDPRIARIGVDAEQVQSAGPRLAQPTRTSDATVGGAVTGVLGVQVVGAQIDRTAASQCAHGEGERLACAAALCGDVEVQARW